MSLPEPDVRKEESVAREDPVTSWLNSEIPHPDEVILERPSKEEAPHRVKAEHAISKFQSLIFDLTYEQAKEAYVRLLVARGFHKPSPPPKAMAQGTASEANAQAEVTSPGKLRRIDADARGSIKRKGFLQFLREQLIRRQP